MEPVDSIGGEWGKFSMFARAVLSLLALLAVSVPAAAETWHRADTHHFTIYSDGRTKQLEEFAHEVEKFDALLRVLFKRPVKDDAAKLTIYLLGDTDDVSRLGGRNVAGFYSVNAQETYAVSSRQSASGREGLSGKRVLFHEYAHHFLFHNFGTPAPAWFIEGFAEYVATTEFKRNGEWTFGAPAHHRAYEVQNGPPVPIETLLGENYSQMSPQQRGSFYGWAWALTHMFYSDPEERGDQIGRYLVDLNRGMDNLEAAEKHFGDLSELERALRGYVRRSMAYSKSDRPIPYRDDITVTTLDDVQSELVRLRLLRKTGSDTDKVREQLTRLAAAGNADAWYELAEIEFAEEHRGKESDEPHDFTATEQAVDRALAIVPDHSRALMLKGRLLLEPFDHSDDADEANYARAREYFLQANRADPRNAYALYLYATTAQRAGIEDAMTGPALESAFYFRPEARPYRAALAMHYAKEGEYDRAIGLLKVIANNPHGGGGWARRRIAELEEASNGGIPITAAIDFGGDEGDEGEEDEDTGNDES